MIKNHWNQSLRGIGNAFKTPVLPKGLKYQSMGMAPRDIQFLLQRRLNQSELLAVFGVPPVKVGLVAEAKYNNYNLQERAFYRDTIQPKLRKIQGLLNKFLVREFPGYVFTFDLEPFLQDDASEEVLRCERLFGMGALSSNEIRKKFRLGEPIDGGDTFYISSKFIPVGEESQTLDESRTQAAADDIKEQTDKMLKLKEEMGEFAGVGRNIPDEIREILDNG